MYPLYSHLYWDRYEINKMYTFPYFSFHYIVSCFLYILFFLLCRVTDEMYGSVLFVDYAFIPRNAKSATHGAEFDNFHAYSYSTVSCTADYNSLQTLYHTGR